MTPPEPSPDGEGEQFDHILLKAGTVVHLHGIPLELQRSTWFFGKIENLPNVDSVQTVLVAEELNMPAPTKP